MNSEGGESRETVRGEPSRQAAIGFHESTPLDSKFTGLKEESGSQNPAGQAAAPHLENSPCP